MKLSPKKFYDWQHKAITLLGMSGVGKTSLAYNLPQNTWFHFSGDYRIGTKYLEEPILDNVKKEAMKIPFLRDLLRSDSIYITSNITVHNLVPISTFLGKIGNPELGGLPVDEFKRRQRLHHDAEVGAMRDVADFVVKAREIYSYPHFVNDAGGSVCELDDPRVIETLAKHTVIVYIRADKSAEEKLIARARSNPKPLFYREDFLNPCLAEYFYLKKISSADEIVPDEFVQWIFPKLWAFRKPRYEAIVEKYGYAIESDEAEQVKSESDLLGLIAQALKQG